MASGKARKNLFLNPEALDTLAQAVGNPLVIAPLEALALRYRRPRRAKQIPGETHRTSKVIDPEDDSRWKRRKRGSREG